MQNEKVEVRKMCYNCSNFSKEGRAGYISCKDCAQHSNWVAKEVNKN